MLNRIRRPLRRRLSDSRPEPCPSSRSRTCQPAALRLSPSPLQTPPPAISRNAIATPDAPRKLPPERPVVRPTWSGRPDRLVCLPGPLRPHFHRRHSGPQRIRRSHPNQGTPRDRCLGRHEPRILTLTRLGSAAQWLRHGRNLAPRHSFCRRNRSPRHRRPCAAMAAPTTPTTDGFSTPTPSNRNAFLSPADPSSSTAWASALLTPSASAVRKLSSPASPPTRSPRLPPPLHPARTGSVDVEVDDLPMFYACAIISDGISYDSGTGDSLTLNSAPSGTVPIGVPIPFTVTALSLQPRSGGRTSPSPLRSPAATRHSAAVPSSCSIASTGDGIATINITAPAAGPSVVIASLSNGASLQAHFSGGTPPSLAALTPMLSVAAGVHRRLDHPGSRPDQRLTRSAAKPSPGKPSSIIRTNGSSTATTNSSGIAAKSLTVGPLE